MVAGAVLMLIGVLLFPIYRIYEPTARANAAEQTQNNLALAGEGIWTSTCSSCHGANGQGVDAPALNSMQFLAIASNEQILAIVSAGIPGSDMAAYGQQFGGPLTQEQIVSVVACIRSWEPTAPDRPDWRDIPAEGDGGHDEDGDADGDGHDEVTTESPPACGPNYDPADFEDDHDEEAPADGDSHDEDGDEDGDGHDEDSDSHNG